MHRRLLLSLLLGGFAGSVARQTVAASAFTTAEGQKALQLALQRGAEAAVGQLGKPGGFLQDDRLRIRLPSVLERAAPLLKPLGMGQQLEELRVGMNHAAEQAVPMALPLLQSAIQSMTVTDVQSILRGGETSVTDFFVSKTRQPLTVRFLPEVGRVTDRLALARQYNALAAKAGGVGLLQGDEASVEQYVTARALDGLFKLIGEQERAIRQDPLGTGSVILKKVFGSL